MNNLYGSLSFHGNVSGQMGSNLVTNVEANPSGTPTEILTSIRVGDIIYSIPSGGGDGGGTNNYNELLNKPKINNVTLTGNKTLDELSIQSKINFPMDSSKYLDGEGNFTTPPSGSSIQIDSLWQGTANQLNVDYTLDSSIEDYDFLLFLIHPSDLLTETKTLFQPVNTLTNYNVNTFSYIYYTTFYCRGLFSNSTTFHITILSGDAIPIIYEIKGIKL